MKLIFTIIIPICFYQAAAQQFAAAVSQPAAKIIQQKTKPASYTALGYNIPLAKKDVIIGGTTTVYKKFGTFISYKAGIQNLLMPTHGERGELTYDNVVKNNWTITGKTEQSATFMLNGGLAIAVTRKIPFYIGAGVVRYREFFEYTDPGDNKNKWNVNEHRTRLEMNYTAGIFVPLFGRVVMNAGYDHNPQSIFVGLGIYGIYNFEDADDWWW